MTVPRPWMPRLNSSTPIGYPGGIHTKGGQAKMFNNDEPLAIQTFDDRVLLNTWTDEAGVFTVWGSQPVPNITIKETVSDKSAAPKVGSLSRRRAASQSICQKKPTSECARSNGAPVDVCEALVQSFEGNKGNGWIRLGPLNYCLENYDGKCCIGWSAEITDDVRIKELVPAARIVLKDCPDDQDQISGKVFDVQIGNHCINQCLSSFPGC